MCKNKGVACIDCEHNGMTVDCPKFRQRKSCSVCGAVHYKDEMHNTYDKNYVCNECYYHDTKCNDIEKKIRNEQKYLQDRSFTLNDLETKQAQNEYKLQYTILMGRGNTLFYLCKREALKREKERIGK